MSDTTSTLPADLPPRKTSRPTLPGTIAVTWGVSGFVLLMGFALWRLTPLALESFAYEWRWYHVAVFVLNLVFMAWTEGYRGFQQAFSPRLAARCHYLLSRASWPQALLAPLVVMNFTHATRRRMIIAWTLTIGIVAVVLIYRQLPQPWRGILDAGVVLGLAWGLVATLSHVLRALRNGPMADPEFPA